jgi:hypothetical protein
MLIPMLTVVHEYPLPCSMRRHGGDGVRRWIGQQNCVAPLRHVAGKHDIQVLEDLCKLDKETFKLITRKGEELE